MPSPFPGMDPYIERPALWPDFHLGLISEIRRDLQPLLKPRYAAVMQERLYVIESDRPIYPDVAIVRQSKHMGSETGASAAATADVAAVFELWREDVREPFIEIIEPAAGGRVVTAIEVLSPTNKEAAAGRSAYLEKREEYWRAGTNLVEIDLLHDGQPTIRLSSEKLATLGHWNYLVAVTRHFPSRQEVYAIPLDRRLPRVAIPLDSGVPDVTLDLQATFTRAWEIGPYPGLLRYDGPPPGKWGNEEVNWCRQMLADVGH